MSAASSEIRAESLLKELAGVWKELDKTESSYAVVRACSMTLMVADIGTAGEQDIAGTLGDLMYSHPGRYISLRIVDQAEPLLQARVFAQCQLAFGRRQQLCCEQIEFSATRNRISDFYAVALGLAVADLPVLLWIRKAELLLDSEFHPLLRLARSLLLDSAQFTSPLTGLAEMESRRQAGWRIKDLNWTRLTPWRETIAQMFETAACRTLASRIRKVEVSGRADEPAVDVQYLATWLAQRLPAAGISATGGGVERVRLIAEDCTLEVSAAAGSGGETLTATSAGGMVTLVHAPLASDAALLSEELGILGPDPTFEATLPETLSRARATL